jgi:hypothetical protein
MQQSPSSEASSCSASQKFVAFYEDQKFITVFVGVRYCCPQMNPFLRTNFWGVIQCAENISSSHE